ncbi:MAG: hypothetical protein KC776_06920 [Myxococcales bacterium]|nr:hypothetical protein [Myxococcales bacterium]MCB9579170.1 hypothetical protein [Polyangiaceae bacterium]
MFWRLFESIHGHLGVLTVAALVHPALLLRQGKPLTRRNRWAVGLSTAFTLAVYGTGIAMYGAYRALVKRHLFTDSVRAGLMFETKEHVAVVVVGLALGAAIAAFVAPKQATAVRRVAALFFAFAALAALCVVVLGTQVASVRSF